MRGAVFTTHQHEGSTAIRRLIGKSLVLQKRVGIIHAKKNQPNFFE
jgi:hypothetical protein